jgi:hypothetical protein
MLEVEFTFEGTGGALMRDVTTTRSTTLPPIPIRWVRKEGQSVQGEGLSDPSLSMTRPLLRATPLLLSC